jgi:hypothetical protein
MGQPVTQHSFRGGEIAPEFYGNTRNPLHGFSLGPARTSCRSCTARS